MGSLTGPQRWVGVSKMGKGYVVRSYRDLDVSSNSLFLFWAFRNDDELFSVNKLLVRRQRGIWFLPLSGYIAFFLACTLVKYPQKNKIKSVVIENNRSGNSTTWKYMRNYISSIDVCKVRSSYNADSHSASQTSLLKWLGTFILHQLTNAGVKASWALC